MAMDFVAPLPGALSRTPALQAQGAQGASFRSAAPREAGPNVWLQLGLKWKTGYVFINQHGDIMDGSIYEVDGFKEESI